MLTIREAAKRIPLFQERNGHRAQPQVPKTSPVPVDKVTLQEKTNGNAKRVDENLIATYWG